MEKKNEYISYETFINSFGGANIPTDAAMSLYEFIKNNKKATRKWMEISQSDDFKNNMSFILNYATNQSKKIKKQDSTLKKLVGIIAICLGIGGVFTVANSIGDYCEEYVLSRGPQGTEVKNYISNDSITIGSNGENCNSGINLTLNNKDIHYNNSVVLITDLQNRISKSLRIVDATEPVRVSATAGNYQVMLVTLPNGDVCGNIFNVEVQDGCFTSLDINANYQFEENKVL